MDSLLDPRIVGALGLMVLLTIAPGPDMALVTSTSLLHGRRAAWRTSLGISSGTLIWASLAGIGVAAVLAASSEAFTVVRIAGATYLVYLGLRALADAFRGERGTTLDATSTGQAIRPYRRGLATNLLNPKVGLFYTTLVPQLVDPGDPIALVSIAVGVAHATIGLIWLVGLAAAVDRIGDVLRRPRVRRALGGATAAILIGFGVRVAADPQ